LFVNKAVVEYWALAAEEQSVSSAPLLLLARFCSIQQQSEGMLDSFPERLGTTFREAAAFDWLVLVRGVAALHLEGVVGEDHLEAVLLDFDRVEAWAMSPR
jgi:hypothetical protein